MDSGQCKGKPGTGSREVVQLFNEIITITVYPYSQWTTSHLPNASAVSNGVVTSKVLRDVRSNLREIEAYHKD